MIVQQQTNAIGSNARGALMRGRFVKGRDSNGHALGLAFARAIAVAHGGS